MKIIALSLICLGSCLTLSCHADGRKPGQGPVAEALRSKLKSFMKEDSDAEAANPTRGGQVVVNNNFDIFVHQDNVRVQPAEEPESVTSTNLTVESTGKIAKNAIDQFMRGQFAKARRALMKSQRIPTPDAIQQWLLQEDPDFQTFIPLRDHWARTHRAWLNLNRHTITMVDSPPIKADAIKAAADLTGFIATVVPGVQVVNP